MRRALDSRWAFLALATSLTFGLGAFLATHPARPIVKGSPEARSAKTELDRLRSLPPGKSEGALRGFVERSRASGDKDVQDLVATARTTLGYLAAGRKDWATAERAFKDADRSYAGRGQTVDGFGRLDEQAAYQAIVSVQASGDKGRATREYAKYLKERPYSPLCFAVYDRLCRLDPRGTAKYERLLAEATAKATEKRSLDEAKCGPKVLARLLWLKDGKEVSLGAATKACGTTKEGTSMDAMAKAVASTGHSAKGVLLNRRDFANLRTPAVWLWSGHYVLLTEVAENTARVYDPMDDSERSVRLPSIDDTDFQAVALTVDQDR